MPSSNRPMSAAYLVKQVAQEQNLSDDWLNGEVRQFLSSLGDRRPFPTREFEPGLQITIPTPTYLLTLKLNACRQPMPGLPG
ncbi:MAG: hypothetical protein J6386_09245 [Candidatus Synoicihabitans palmerolidicus]|nr:hypothetical protein [Candidatus Synoicihabitans palmerolidicus]